MQLNSFPDVIIQVAAVVVVVVVAGVTDLGLPSHGEKMWGGIKFHGISPLPTCNFPISLMSSLSSAAAAAAVAAVNA